MRDRSRRVAPNDRVDDDPAAIGKAEAAIAGDGVAGDQAATLDQTGAGSFSRRVIALIGRVV
ncbi:MAG: hypothetical protein Kow0059_05600 [Candidatus Sumerlaeia bacterium]